VNENRQRFDGFAKNYRPFWLYMVNVLHPHFAAYTSLACWCKTRQLRQNPARHFVQ
jgi:hypothetical protein